jgi:hypothetical protein
MRQYNLSQQHQMRHSLRDTSTRANMQRHKEQQAQRRANRFLQSQTNNQEDIQTTTTGYVKRKAKA